MKIRNIHSFFASLTFILVILLPSIVPSTHPSPTLDVTVFTDKPFYYYGENATLYGNLTENGNLTVGLVALEIRNPLGSVYIARTLPTGPNPVVYGNISITKVEPCDPWGNPKRNFTRGSTAYFRVWVRNVADEPQIVKLITVNVFDVNMNSLGVIPFFNLLVNSNWSADVILAFTIPEEASIGTATVYANAYTNWPSLGGSTYCPERNASFQITEPPGGSSATLDTETQSLNINQGTDGTYSLTFRLPLWAKAGDYNVYVSARYRWQQSSTKNEIFTLTLLGDANGDGVVDSTDLGLLGLAWPPGPYNPNCDFNDDGVIDSTDFGILGLYWGQG